MFRVQNGGSTVLRNAFIPEDGSSMVLRNVLDPKK
jgi:hypothetical protein